MTDFKTYAILNISNKTNGCSLPSDERKGSYMTMREMLNAVVELADAYDHAEDIETFGSIHASATEIAEKATEELKKLDARNEKRASKPSKVAEANVPLIEKLEAFLEGKEAMIASDIATQLEITPNKVASLAKASEKIQITKTRHKGREVNQYSLIVED